MSDGGMGQLLAGFAKLKPKAGIALAELADASHRVAQATGDCRAIDRRTAIGRSADSERATRR